MPRPLATTYHGNAITEGEQCDFYTNTIMFSRAKRI